jgi:hypothetical protein
MARQRADITYDERFQKKDKRMRTRPWRAMRTGMIAAALISSMALIGPAVAAGTAASGGALGTGTSVRSGKNADTVPRNTIGLDAVNPANGGVAGTGMGQSTGDVKGLGTGQSVSGPQGQGLDPASKKRSLKHRPVKKHP